MVASQSELSGFGLRWQHTIWRTTCSRCDEVVAVVGGSAAVGGEDDGEREERGERRGGKGEWILAAVVECSVWKICRRSGWFSLVWSQHVELRMQYVSSSREWWAMNIAFMCTESSLGVYGYVKACGGAGSVWVA